MTNPNDYDAMLTLAIPTTLSEEISDFLLLNTQLANGFSIVAAQGMGQGASLLSAMEKVHGHCNRNLIFIVGINENLQQLLHMLGGKIKNNDVAYWFTPVTRFGRL
ncbi:DUF3240 family protein [Undibacterium sp. Xuan67W]|uniref:DUF3240 family protein n=1 Tax=Undibacterium sp. Xuan67W TaxID=3413057 RepID=UPI003BF1424F